MQIFQQNKNKPSFPVAAKYVKKRVYNVGEVLNLADVGRTDVELYKPTVTVSTQRTDNQIIIKVKDNGIGMSKEVQSKIFQPFFTTKPTGAGTGLGLSLAYDIITKGYMGKIECESVECKGSEFIITIPFKNNDL